MTAVVLAGDFPSTGIIRATAAQRFGVDGGEETPLAFIDHVGNALRQKGAVLVVYPAWKGERVHRLVRLARSALLTDRIAALPVDVPPLALSLIADQLTFVSPHVRPGLVASLARRLCENIRTGAWVNSVAHLEHIKTGLGAHVASYLRSGGFSVFAGPRSGVHRITSREPVQDLGPRPVDPVLMVFSDANGDVDWLHRRLGPMVAAASLNPVAAQPMSAEFWGTRKYTEYVAFSGHPQALQSLLAQSTYRPCGWCGEPTALPECPFCCMVQPGMKDAPAAPPAQGPVPPRPAPPQAPVPINARPAPVAPLPAPTPPEPASVGPAAEPAPHRYPDSSATRPELRIPVRRPPDVAFGKPAAPARRDPVPSVPFGTSADTSATAHGGNGADPRKDISPPPAQRDGADAAFSPPGSWGNGGSAAGPHEDEPQADTRQDGRARSSGEAVLWPTAEFTAAGGSAPPPGAVADPEPEWPPEAPPAPPPTSAPAASPPPQPPAGGRR